MQLNIYLPLAICLLSGHTLFAQQPAPTPVRVRQSSITYRAESIDDKAIIYNDSTGERMPLSRFAELNRADPRGYRLIPTYNEYGKPGFYRFRPTTKEEREFGRFIDVDPKLAPKVGDKLLPFIMQGTNGKMYTSENLAGQNVVLSFWVALRPPFADPNRLETLTQVISPYVQSGKLVSIGITTETVDDMAEPMRSQTTPFALVADGRGFNQRYQVTVSPTIIIIDKTGTVVANLQGYGTDELEKMLKGLK